MSNKKEKYCYNDEASEEMLVKLLITCDGVGKEQKQKALSKLLERCSKNK